MVAAPPLSKAEYLKRYLSGADAGQEGGTESLRKRYKKGPKPGSTTGNGLRIVDDDVGWAIISTAKPEKEEEEDGDLPVVAEFVDEHPDERQGLVLCAWHYSEILKIYTDAHALATAMVAALLFSKAESARCRSHSSPLGGLGILAATATMATSGST
ncbi:hypothetical protein ACRRTK_017131 [Alexandromys fortis]